MLPATTTRATVPPMSLGISSKHLSALLLLVLFSCRQGNAAPTEQRSTKAVMFGQLEAESPEERRAAAAKIVDMRRAQEQQIADLLAKVLAVPDREGTAKDLILLLGKLHATEQVPILVQSLTFQVFYRASKRPQTTEDLFPAVQALIDIGTPALDPVIERLQSESGGDVQRAGTAVLRGILGLQRAKLVMAGLVHAARTSEIRERLRRAERVMQELP